LFVNKRLNNHTLLIDVNKTTLPCIGNKIIYLNNKIRKSRAKTLFTKVVIN